MDVKAITYELMVARSTGRLYLRITNEREGLIRGTSTELTVPCAIELYNYIKRHLEELVKEKKCHVCINFKQGVVVCGLEMSEYRECIQEGKKYFKPMEW